MNKTFISTTVFLSLLVTLPMAMGEDHWVELFSGRNIEGPQVEFAAKYPDRASLSENIYGQG